MARFDRPEESRNSKNMEQIFKSSLLENKRCPQKFVPHLCGYCGGAVYSIISAFMQLHRSSFNLEFETLLESI